MSESKNDRSASRLSDTTADALTRPPLLPSTISQVKKSAPKLLPLFKMFSERYPCITQYQNKIFFIKFVIGKKCRAYFFRTDLRDAISEYRLSLPNKQLTGQLSDLENAVDKILARKFGPPCR